MRCPAPLGIGYVAAYLRQSGYEVSILDCVIEGHANRRTAAADIDVVGLESREIASAVAAYNPTHVGVSCLMSSQLQNMLDTCRIVKAISPEIVVFTGGAHPSALPDDVLRNKEIDAVIIGEGERGSLAVLEGARGKVVSPILDVEHLPWPARDIMSMGKYIKKNAPMNLYTRYNSVTQIATSRGCPFQCSFCATTRFHGRWRGRSALDVLKEMRFLYDTYQVQELNIVDENFIYDRNRAMEILGNVSETGIRALSAPGGVWIQGLDDGLLGTMRKAGFYQITFPIESSDPDILRNVIHKPLDLKIVPGLVRTAKKLGMDTHAFFIFGFPEQTEEHLRRDCEYAKSLGFDSISVSVLAPYPGSPYYAKHREQINMDRLWSTRANVPHPLYSPEQVEGLAMGYSKTFNKGLFWRRPVKFCDKYLGTMLRRLRLRDWSTLFCKH